MKPLIGLTPLYREYREMDRSILGKSYTDIVQQAGGLPVLIPPVIDPEDLASLLRRLDGIVLTGGDDLAPDLYGEDGSELTPKPGHPRRSRHDRLIFEYVWQQKVPTLAICLGLQEINVFLGGTLYQDIPKQIKQAQVHKIGDWFEARHNVELLEGSLLERLVGSGNVETNSAHHQSVRHVAKELQITGRSQDGVIEALEPRDGSIPLLAVQWHPESETNAACGITLFEWLISESASRMNNPAI
ncbi:MAG: gamma-glutamyl-gamma-aminobutyrate hydrolase family protein [Candidatus Marinimicrobia bacterium]|nr:gamma-glutamyl-gamma-aminobutyrate hydrolase family protein [Candidatus Neomarinimicrobiota bacterium]